MSRALVASIAINAGLALRLTVDKLIAGVAFIEDDHRFYRVFSHEGDELGILSVIDVEYAISYMKRYGIEVGKCEHPAYRGGYSRCHPGFTFAWRGWYL